MKIKKLLLSILSFVTIILAGLFLLTKSVTGKAHTTVKINSDLRYEIASIMTEIEGQQAKKQEQINIKELAETSILEINETINTSRGDIDSINKEIVKNKCSLGLVYNNKCGETITETKAPVSKGLMTIICERGTINGLVSPLCNNQELYNKLENISKEKGVDFGLMVGITYAESHIGINFKPQKCSASNNWAGIKREKYDDGSNSPRFNHMDNWINGCWVYTFDSVEHFRSSFANGLKFGYIDKNCTSAECISRRRVGGDGEISKERTNRVNIFTK